MSSTPWHQLVPGLITGFIIGLVSLVRSTGKRHLVVPIVGNCKYSIAPRSTPEDCSKIGHSTVASSINEAITKSNIIFLCLADDASINKKVGKIAQGECQGQADCRL